MAQARSPRSNPDRDALVQGSAIRRKDSPLFAALLRAIAESEELQQLAGLAPRFGARLLRSAIHYLLLAKREHDLAAYYPSITPRPLPADEAGPALTAFCLEHRV